MGDPRRLGRVGFKTLLYTVLVSAIAVLIGVTLVNVLRPGAGISPELKARLTQGAAERASTLATATRSQDGHRPAGPDRPRQPGQGRGRRRHARGDVLLPGVRDRPGPHPHRGRGPRFQDAIQGLYDVTMRLIDMVIALAPIGVAALLFTLTAQLGYEILQQLALYVGVVVLALAIHQFVVYSLAVRLLGGMSPLAFFRGIQEAMITAFSTASSNATLPTALRVAEENLRLPPSVSRFVLTIGSTMNQNGTALFEGVTVLFLAQFYGVQLSLAQQIAGGPDLHPGRHRHGRRAPPVRSRWWR